MLAGPQTSPFIMRRALSFTISALKAAAAIDCDRSAEDRAAFGEQQARLEPHYAALLKADRALEDYDLGEGTYLQAAVILGDEVLDRGLRDGNQRTKLALRGKSGLDSTHVFGSRITDLTEAKIRLEPSKVLAAVSRFDDLPEFSEREAIKQDLTSRATTQEEQLVARDKGDARRNLLASAVVRSVAEAADALASVKGALDHRFPRQRDYVGAFFLDVRPRPSKASAHDDGHGDNK